MLQASADSRPVYRVMMENWKSTGGKLPMRIAGKQTR